jgi:hypothetical protein
MPAVSPSPHPLPAGERIKVRGKAVSMFNAFVIGVDVSGMIGFFQRRAFIPSLFRNFLVVFFTQGTRPHWSISQKENRLWYRKQAAS